MDFILSKNFIFNPSELFFFFFFFFRRNLNVFKKHDFTPKLLSYVQMYIFKNLGEQWRFTIYQQLE